MFARILVAVAMMTTTASAFEHTIAPKPVWLVGDDYNGDLGVSPRPEIEISSIVQGQPAGVPIPFQVITPGAGGRDWVVESSLLLRCDNILPGQPIDLLSSTCKSTAQEYHAYWTAEPVDHQYGRLAYYAPAGSGGSTKFGELPPEIRSYYLFGGQMRLTRGPLSGNLTAVITYPIANDGARQPDEPVIPSLVPHEDGIRTWVETTTDSGDVHRLLIDSVRPLSLWEEVDDWSLRQYERAPQYDAAGYTVNGVPTPSTVTVHLPEPSSWSMAMIIVLSGVFAARLSHVARRQPGRHYEEHRRARSRSTPR